MGWKILLPIPTRPCQGLKTKFPVKVRLVGLGAGANIRGKNPDFNLEIAEKDITPADIELLTRELNLKETTATSLDALYTSFGSNWFNAFKQMVNGRTEENEDGKRVPAPESTEYWANENGVNAAAVVGLRSKMDRLFKLPYVVEEPAADSLKQIINALEAGQHVVLSFGKARTRPGLSAGDKPAHPQDPRAMGEDHQ